MYTIYFYFVLFILIRGSFIITDGSVLKGCVLAPSQEQYQYLYQAVLSLVSSKDDQKALQSTETNGSLALGQNNIAESLESLM